MAWERTGSWECEFGFEGVSCLCSQRERERERERIPAGLFVFLSPPPLSLVWFGERKRLRERCKIWGLGFFVCKFRLARHHVHIRLTITTALKKKSQDALPTWTWRREYQTCACSCSKRKKGRWKCECDECNSTSVEVQDESLIFPNFFLRGSSHKAACTSRL